MNLIAISTFISLHCKVRSLLENVAYICRIWTASLILLYKYFYVDQRWSNNFTTSSKNVFCAIWHSMTREMIFFNKHWHSKRILLIFRFFVDSILNCLFFNFHVSLFDSFFNITPFCFTCFQKSCIANWRQRNPLNSTSLM